MTHALITLRPNVNEVAVPGIAVLTRERWLDDTIGTNADVSRAMLTAVLAMAVASTSIPTAQPTAPWWVITLVAAGATALVLLASHATGAVALRRRPLTA